MQQPGDMKTSIPDALANALGRVVAETKRGFEKDLSLLEAQGRAFMAELTARRFALEAEMQASLDARIKEAVAGLQDGASGVDGRDGADGKDGEKGEPGIPGERGEKGEPGEQGPQGPAGERGEKGEPGEPGAQGEPGQPGERGEKGDTGEKGDPGDRGERGPAGVFAAPKSFVEGRVHYEGDLVFHEGSTWCATTDTAQPPPGDDWAPVAMRGAPAPLPEVKGLFEIGREYKALSIVAANGASWIAVKDNPSPEIPGDGWALLAQKGKRGDRGERGERGPAGIAGKDGGPAPRIEGFTLHEWKLVAVMSDGSKTACDLRPLFERYQEESGSQQ